MADTGDGPSLGLPVVLLGAIALGCLWLVYFFSGPDQAESTAPTTQQAPPQAGGKAQPDTQPAATGPTTHPAAPWRPPRFASHQAERRRMVGVIAGYGLNDRAILAAMSHVPRDEFVPGAYRRLAHADRPLPIGHGQTISQPYIVAEMTRLLKLDADSRVLEIGTGSGYQAAVLAEFTPHVYSIEIIGALATAARERLDRLGYRPVRTRHGDGYYGWPEAAPFDAIIVTAAAGHIPPALIQQLKSGGTMVIPVGAPFATQSLMLVEKDPQGKVRTRSVMAVRFVPLVRKDASRK